jgi:hypothetical protein
METKYGKYILTELKVPENYQAVPDSPDSFRRRILFLDDKTIEGALYLAASWFVTSSENHAPPPTHTHDHDEVLAFFGNDPEDALDEVLAFFGNDPEDPLDLGGEIEMWLGGEQHMITRSCLIFIPKGLPHCPYYVRRVDRPILHFSTAPMGSYEKKESG